MEDSRTPLLVACTLGAIGTVSVCCRRDTSRSVLKSKLTRGLRPEIVLFGDSITQQSFQVGGWGAKIASAFQRTADVKSRGVSGYNTRWALSLLPDIFPVAGPAPLLVTIMFGANDANLPAPLQGLPAELSRQHVPLEEYVQNLRRMVAAVRSCGDGSAKILLLTPSPVDTKAWHKFLLQESPASKLNLALTTQPARDFETTRRYVEACLRAGEEMGVPTVNVHDAFVSQYHWERNLRDGLHPNAGGGQVLAEAVLESIHQYYPDLKSLSLDFPDIDSIDATDCAAAFVHFGPPRLPLVPAVEYLPEIVLFGDGITQQSFANSGWGARLADYFQRRADVRLRGFSGYNSRCALQVLPTVFPQGGPSPALVTVMFGGNDAVKASHPGHVPIAEYKLNLRSIITAIRSCGEPPARVLLITPPPCNGPAWHIFCIKKFREDLVRASAIASDEPDLDYSRMKLYADACREVGAATGTPVVDLFDICSKRPGGWELCFPDGVHPNPDGGELIFNSVKDCVACFPELMSAPSVFPDWHDIDPERVSESIQVHRATRR